MRTKNTTNTNVVTINAAKAKKARKTFAERFTANLTDQPNGCQTWNGAVNPVTGYGETYYKGKVTGAHRAAYALKFGAVPEGMFVCHTCDVKTCCNTGDEQGSGSHLFLGNAAMNNQDKANKGRSTKGRTLVNKRYTKDERTNILTMKLEGQSAYKISQQLGKTPPGINKFLKAHKAATAAKIRANAESIITAATEFRDTLNTILDEAADIKKAA